MSGQVARLDWRPASPFLFAASGIRGTYQVQRTSAGWLLTGREHTTGLVMLNMPACGVVRADLNQVQRLAERLDHQMPAGEMSGAG